MNNTVPFPRRNKHGENQNEDALAPVPASRWRQFTDRAGDWAIDRLEEILDAPSDGWSGAATWIKILTVLAGGILSLLALRWGITALIDAVRGAQWDPPGTGLVATLHQPVWEYLRTHSAALPASTTTLYATWQLFGGISFLLAWWLRATGARLTWTAWGAATTAMIWAASPAPGRTIAAGLAVLAWTAASTLALHGLSLRSTSFVHVHNDVQPTPIQVRPTIHVPPPVVERMEINGRELRSAD
ncbi:hypothetical protein [Streptomyces agglomeratus]|uniref:hypothetical protein n=1 Tax=Streptomyces agglomeratus TaxID=285458 RepID=UPI0008550A11|nr:hypothetical protein [Streptomyces agglomeratus]OEJ36338.1 hypothetical protein BGK72_38930 [Streptomyces agglomeratus]